MSTTPTIAFFITPHGFGHASRAAAVMEAVKRRRPEVRFELFTTCPAQIFKDTVGYPFGYHQIQSDIGMVQLSPLREDVTATCDNLDRLLPYDSDWIFELAAHLKQLKCRMVICDIAPLGIQVARAAGIPSVLIENFTWDWIYEHYLGENQRLKSHVAYLADIFKLADHRIQTPPLCKTSNRAVLTAPISRNPKSSRYRIRRRLKIPKEDKMVLVTMGGVPDALEFISKLPSKLDWYLVVTGAHTRQSPHEKVILLPVHSSFFHPDLIAAADAIVGKAGYSTVAEAYQSGIPFGYIKRPLSPESAVLEAYIKSNMPSMAISTRSYTSGNWIAKVPVLLSIPRGPHRTKNGADEAASVLLEIYDDLIK